jgi:cbb3-type cytochrome oxidase cytochrome c subunit
MMMMMMMMMTTMMMMIIISIISIMMKTITRTRIQKTNAIKLYGCVHIALEALYVFVCQAQISRYLSVQPQRYADEEKLLILVRWWSKQSVYLKTL